MSFSYLRSHWKNTLENRRQTRVCRHINETAIGGGDSTAIGLLSLGRANSSVNFLTGPSRLPAQKTLWFEERLEEVGSSPNAASLHEKIIVSSLPRAAGVFP